MTVVADDRRYSSLNGDHNRRQPVVAPRSGNLQSSLPRRSVNRSTTTTATQNSHQRDEHQDSRAPKLSPSLGGSRLAARRLQSHDMPPPPTPSSANHNRRSSLKEPSSIEASLLARAEQRARQRATVDFPRLMDRKSTSSTSVSRASSTVPPTPTTPKRASRVKSPWALIKSTTDWEGEGSDDKRDRRAAAKEDALRKLDGLGPATPSRSRPPTSTSSRPPTPSANVRTVRTPTRRRTQTLPSAPNPPVPKNLDLPPLQMSALSTPITSRIGRLPKSSANVSRIPPPKPIVSPTIPATASRATFASSSRFGFNSSIRDTSSRSINVNTRESNSNTRDFNTRDISRNDGREFSPSTSRSSSISSSYKSKIPLYSPKTSPQQTHSILRTPLQGKSAALKVALDQDAARVTDRAADRLPRSRRPSEADSTDTGRISGRSIRSRRPSEADSIDATRIPERQSRRPSEANSIETYGLRITNGSNRSDFASAESSLNLRKARAPVPRVNGTRQSDVTSSASAARHVSRKSNESLAERVPVAARKISDHTLSSARKSVDPAVFSRESTNRSASELVAERMQQMSLEQTVDRATQKALQRAQAEQRVSRVNADNKSILQRRAERQTDIRSFSMNRTENQPSLQPKPELSQRSPATPTFAVTPTSTTRPAFTSTEIVNRKVLDDYLAEQTYNVNSLAARSTSAKSAEQSPGSKTSYRKSYGGSLVTPTSDRLRVHESPSSKQLESPAITKYDIDRTPFTVKSFDLSPSSNHVFNNITTDKAFDHSLVDDSFDPPLSPKAVADRRGERRDEGRDDRSRKSLADFSTLKRSSSGIRNRVDAVLARRNSSKQEEAINGKSGRKSASSFLGRISPFSKASHNVKPPKSAGLPPPPRKLSQDSISFKEAASRRHSLGGVSVTTTTRSISSRVNENGSDALGPEPESPQSPRDQEPPRTPRSMRRTPSGGIAVANGTLTEEIINTMRMDRKKQYTQEAAQYQFPSPASPNRSEARSDTTLSFVDRSRSAIRATKTKSSLDSPLSRATPEMTRSLSVQPRTGQQALKDLHHQLTAYERMEIVSYPIVYFVGLPKASKVPARPERATLNYGYDDERGEYKWKKGDHIGYRYEIVGTLGKGSFGNVLHCKDHALGIHVAVKIIRNRAAFQEQAQVEVTMLESLKRLDPNDEAHIIRPLDHSEFRRHLCIVTEVLSMNLYEFIKANDFKGFGTDLIRTFSVQILKALALLTDNGIVHCDLKPENILMQDPHKSALKVIDFGSSCYENARKFSYIQSRFYRSPEVLVGQAYGPAIDMWSLGCILAELAIGYPLFPGEDERDQMACIVEVLGVPSKRLWQNGTRATQYFHSDGRMRTFKNSKGKTRRPSARPLSTALRRCNDDAFVDFIADCLEIDPTLRLKPKEALRHRWIRRA